MVGEGDYMGSGPVRSEVWGMDKPIEVTTMLLGGPAGMGDLTGSVPLGCEVLWNDIPIPTHEPGNPTNAGEKLLELSKQLMAYVFLLRVRARGPVH